MKLQSGDELVGMDILPMSIVAKLAITENEEIDDDSEELPVLNGDGALGFSDHHQRLWEAGSRLPIPLAKSGG
uniref:Uncharacterized protein n=1 Tax=Desertifilum tharense IPPAS B-1220 TaxID=1781255 RepID=A0ACD5H2Q1_9CYAN